jgi:hypothetical protein
MLHPVLLKPYGIPHDKACHVKGKEEDLPVFTGKGNQGDVFRFQGRLKGLPFPGVCETEDNHRPHNVFPLRFAADFPAGHCQAFQSFVLRGKSSQEIVEKGVYITGHVREGVPPKAQAESQDKGRDTFVFHHFLSSLCDFLYGRPSIWAAKTNRASFFVSMFRIRIDCLRFGALPGLSGIPFPFELTCSITRLVISQVLQNAPHFAIFKRLLFKN